MAYEGSEILSCLQADELACCILWLLVADIEFEFELVMDREARGAAIPGVAKSRIRLSH